MGPSDELVVLLAGHGSFRDQTARFNIPGPDVTPEELGVLMAPLGDRRITFVNTASASGAFIEALSGPNRTIITATRSGRERNMTRFGLHFVDAFADDGADVNKDARVSMLEAFGYAMREVQRQYEGDRQLLTEHAVLDDNGDGEGSREPGELEGDGVLASTIFLTSLGGAGADEAVTEELRALYEEKAEIEAASPTCGASRTGCRGALEDELEALLVDLALKNREIRAAGAGRKRGPLRKMRFAEPIGRPPSWRGCRAVALTGERRTPCPSRPAAEAPGFAARGRRVTTAVQALGPGHRRNAAALRGW